MTSPLDAALAHLHQYSQEYKDSLASHGPMAAEALESMGLEGSIQAFVDRYERILEPIQREPGPGGDWREGIGVAGSHVWLTDVVLEWIERDGVDAVAREVLPPLMPGLAGGAFHGLIRVGHALRGHRRVPSSVRAAEVAHALAYCASAFQELPGVPGARASAGRTAAEVLANTPLIDEGERKAGLIARRFGPLLEWDAFRDVVESLDPEAASPRETVLAVARFGAGSNARATSGRDRFTYLHVTTASSALLTALDWLGSDDARLAAGFLVRAAAAIHATHGHTQVPDAELPEPLPPAEIAAKAAATLDDHVIKFAEACIRLHDEAPDGPFLAAATAAVSR